MGSYYDYMACTNAYSHKKIDPLHPMPLKNYKNFNCFNLNIWIGDQYMFGPSKHNYEVRLAPLCPNFLTKSESKALIPCLI